MTQFDAFMPHGMCYMWRWDMLLLQVGSDLLIALAYFSIPAALVALMRKRPDLPQGILKLFVAFILLCGITHLIGVIVVWEPIYLIQGFAKLATAAVSIATAIALWPLVPKITATPTVAELEARNQEIADLNTRLEARLASLTNLAGGVSHDFNNMLTVIAGNVELLRTETSDPEQQRKLDSISTASQRCAEICRKMLAYSGNGHFVMQQCNLDEIIDSTELTVPENCQLVVEVEPNLPPLLGSARQLRELLTAMLANAVEAVEESGSFEGRIEISARKQHVSSHDIERSAFETPAEPGDYLVLEIQDNGAGMSADVQERMFDPYFSTKFTGRGLGLAAVQGIVRGHEGCLFVDSTVNDGTLIRVAFPAALPENQQFNPPRFPRPRLVLIVDDEAPVLDLASRYLQDLGLRVLTAQDVDMAESLVSQYGDEIDALILDYQMPGANGLQLLDRLGDRINADTYLTSGFSRNEVSTPEVRSRLTGFIAKPFSKRELQNLFGAR
jgi:signal transduction histidine kinase